MTLNSLALRHFDSVILPEAQEDSTPRVSFVLGIQTELSKLGYTLSGQAHRVVSLMDEASLRVFHREVVEEISRKVGGHVNYSPLFRGFPDDVPDDDEYFLRRIFGYLQNEFNLGDISNVLECGHGIDPNLFDMSEYGACPICQFQVSDVDITEANEFYEKIKIRLLHVMTKEELYKKASNLISANTSISQDHVSFVTELFELSNEEEIRMIMPEDIPFKENLVMVSNVLRKNNVDISDILKNYFRTATDILRFAVAINEGDVSLATNTKIRLSNPDRRLFLSLLENVASASQQSLEEDMMRRRAYFLRLGKILHVGKYAKKYPHIAESYDRLRNDHKNIDTFRKTTERLKHDMSIPSLADHLAARPGEFCRLMDFMVRNVGHTNLRDEPTYVLNKFENIADDVATPALMNLSTFFKNRHEKGDVRYFLPKGSVSKIQVIDDERKTIPEEVCLEIMDIAESSLINRFRKNLDENVGKFSFNVPDKTRANVLIDENTRGLVLPLGLRSASIDSEVVGRGTRVQCENTKYVNLFLYWKNGGHYAVDVDLSAVMYSDDWKKLNHVSYTNYSSGDYAVHSGDIQSAPRGASEHIRIDKEKAIAAGVRYVLMNVISYTGQTFDSFYSLAGVECRDVTGGDSGYVDTSAVETKFELNSESRYNVPLVYDLYENAMVWSDLTVGGGRYMNVESRNSVLAKYLQTIVSMSETKPTVHDLFTMYSRAMNANISYERSDDIEYDIELNREFAMNNMEEILSQWIS